MKYENHGNTKGLYFVKIPASIQPKIYYDQKLNRYCCPALSVEWIATPVVRWIVVIPVMLDGFSKVPKSFEKFVPKLEISVIKIQEVVMLL